MTHIEGLTPRELIKRAQLVTRHNDLRIVIRDTHSTSIRGSFLSIGHLSGGNRVARQEALTSLFRVEMAPLTTVVDFSSSTDKLYGEVLNLADEIIPTLENDVYGRLFRSVSSITLDLPYRQHYGRALAVADEVDRQYGGSSFRTLIEVATRRDDTFSPEEFDICQAADVDHNPMYKNLTVTRFIQTGPELLKVPVTSESSSRIHRETFSRCFKIDGKLLEIGVVNIVFESISSSDEETVYRIKASESPILSLSTIFRLEDTMIPLSVIPTLSTKAALIRHLQFMNP